MGGWADASEELPFVISESLPQYMPTFYSCQYLPEGLFSCGLNNAGAGADDETEVWRSFGCKDTGRICM